MPDALGIGYGEPIGGFEPDLSLALKSCVVRALSAAIRALVAARAWSLRNLSASRVAAAVSIHSASADEPGAYPRFVHLSLSRLRSRPRCCSDETQAVRRETTIIEVMASRISTSSVQNDEQSSLDFVTVDPSAIVTEFSLLRQLTCAGDG
jgi:hypothetical protein